MAGVKEVTIQCRCGRMLKKDVVEPSPNPSTIFCDDCYLNHRLEWKGGIPTITHQYYFPDD